MEGFTILAAQSEGKALSSGMALFLGLLAMTLIYIVILLLPKIAAAVDKLLGVKPDKKTSPEETDIPAAAGENEYKVYDIYEGELNLDDNDKKE